MDFPHGVTVLRDRRLQVPDPNNPQRTIPGPWSTAVTVTLQNAFIASASSASIRDGNRQQILTAKSLYCQPDADVRDGDRVRAPDGYVGYVHVIPSGDTNPFTGWRPVVEVPLEEARG